MRSFWLSFVLLATVMANVAVVAEEGDWPQWRGPERDGKAAPQSLLQSWPEGGPTQKWAFETAGRGYSSLSVADGKVFTMGSRDDECYVMCLDAKSGKLLWEQPISRASSDQDYLHGWGGGPRSTPTVDGDAVYALSDTGTVAKLDRRNGAVAWKVDLLEFPGATIPKWGYSESVLIDGDRAVVTPGGEKFLVALDKSSGETIWSSEGADENAQYVSVIKGEHAGQAFYTTAAKSGLFIFDHESGKKLFHTPVTGNGVAVIPTPIVGDGFIYHTSDYGAGNVYLKLKSEAGSVTAEQVYHIDNKSMQNHHGGVVLVDGVIYGFTKADGGQWLAQDLESGDTLWQERLRGNRSGSIAYADGRLYCYNDGDGSLYLIEPNRDSWKVAGKLELPKQTSLDRGRGAIWTHPVIANQTLFIRDQELVYAFDIGR